MLSWLVSFLIVCCVFAIVIIVGRWLISLTGFAIPQPLLLAGGILLFLVLMLWLFYGGPILDIPLPRR